jgi:hypothetical protein
MGRWARQGPRCSPTEFGRYFDILVRSPGTQREPKGSLGLLRRPQSGAAGVAKMPSAPPRTRTKHRRGRQLGMGRRRTRSRSS